MILKLPGGYDNVLALGGRGLSAGQAQRIALARALFRGPRYLILDEPFIGLDPINRQMVLALVRECVARGAAVILSTHLMDQVEALCERAILIHRGKTLLQGTVREMRETYAEVGVLIDTDARLDDHPAIASREGNRFTLVPGTRPEDLLASILATGASVHRFERLRPTLDEVFVRAVGGSSA